MVIIMKKTLIMIAILALVVLAGCSQNTPEIDQQATKAGAKTQGMAVAEKDIQMPSTAEAYQCTQHNREMPMCIKIYKPVCADNGYTYSNSCIACMDPDVESFVDGEC